MLTFLEWFDQYGNSLKFSIILGYIFFSKIYKFRNFTLQFRYIMNYRVKHPLAWWNSLFFIGFLAFGWFSNIFSVVGISLVKSDP